MADGLDHKQRDRALELIGELGHSLTKSAIDELDQLVADTQNERVPSNDGSIDVKLWPRLAEIVRTAEKLKTDIKIAKAESARTSSSGLAMRPSACVVLIRNGKIAAIRSNKHNGALELPGGKAEIGETPFLNAFRECHEEIGVSPFYVRRLLRDDCGGFDCTCFLVESTEELVSSTEGEAVWVTPEELLTGTYASHTAKWLPMVAEELAGQQ